MPEARPAATHETTVQAAGDDTAPPLLRLWRYAARHRPQIVLATTLSVLNKVFDVFPEILIGAAIDVIVNADDSFIADVTGIESQWGQLVALALVNAAVWLLERLTEWGYQLAWRNLAQTVEHEARMDAYAHVQELELGYFEDQSTGGLMAVLNDDVNQLERFLDVGASYMIATVVNVVLVGAVFLVASPLLFLVAFAAHPGDRVGQLPLPAPARAALPRRARAGRAAVSGTLANNLGGIATIKAFTAEERETARVAARERGLPADQPRRDPAELGLRPAHPHRHPDRLHDDPAGRRPPHPRRRAGGRLLLDPGLHDPAPALAAHAPGRDLRPLPARHGQHAAHPRPAGRRADDPGGPGACPSRSAGAVRFEDVRFAYASGPEVLRASTSRSPPARPTPSSASPARARARS